MLRREKDVEMPPDHVKVKFRLLYRPNFEKEQPAVIGSIPELGSWRIDPSWKLHQRARCLPVVSGSEKGLGNQKVWETVMNVPMGTDCQWSWIILNPNGEIESKESLKRRLVVADYCVVFHTEWNSLTEALIQNTCRVDLRTKYITPPGKSVGICGSTCALGKWDPRNCVIMDSCYPRGSGKWRASFTVSNELETEWKLVVIDRETKEVLRWEERGNRSLILCNQWAKIEVTWARDEKIIDTISLDYDKIFNTIKILAAHRQTCVEDADVAGSDGLSIPESRERVPSQYTRSHVSLGQAALDSEPARRTAAPESTEALAPEDMQLPDDEELDEALKQCDSYSTSAPVLPPASAPVVDNSDRINQEVSDVKPKQREDKRRLRKATPQRNTPLIPTWDNNYDVNYQVENVRSLEQYDPNNTTAAKTSAIPPTSATCGDVNDGINQVKDVEAKVMLNVAQTQYNPDNNTAAQASLIPATSARVADNSDRINQEVSDVKPKQTLSEVNRDSYKDSGIFKKRQLRKATPQRNTTLIPTWDDNSDVNYQVKNVRSLEQYDPNNTTAAKTSAIPPTSATCGDVNDGINQVKDVEAKVMLNVAQAQYNPDNNTAAQASLIPATSARVADNSDRINQEVSDVKPKQTLSEVNRDSYKDSGIFKKRQLRKATPQRNTTLIPTWDDNSDVNYQVKNVRSLEQYDPNNTTAAKTSAIPPTSATCGDVNDGINQVKDVEAKVMLNVAQAQYNPDNNTAAQASLIPATSARVADNSDRINQEVSDVKPKQTLSEVNRDSYKDSGIFKKRQLRKATPQRNTTLIPTWDDNSDVNYQVKNVRSLEQYDPNNTIAAKTSAIPPTSATCGDVNDGINQVKDVEAKVMLNVAQAQYNPDNNTAAQASLIPATSARVADNSDRINQEVSDVKPSEVNIDSFQESTVFKRRQLRKESPQRNTSLRNQTPCRVLVNDKTEVVSCEMLENVADSSGDMAVPNGGHQLLKSDLSEKRISEGFSVREDVRSPDPAMMDGRQKSTFFSFGNRNEALRFLGHHRNFTFFPAFLIFLKIINDYYWQTQ